MSQQLLLDPSKLIFQADRTRRSILAVLLPLSARDLMILFGNDLRGNMYPLEALPLMTDGHLLHRELLYTTALIIALR